MRLFIRLSYDGTDFAGWQKQPTGLSVEEVLENALGMLLKRPVELVGSGRTDAGVHAMMQVAHLDMAEEELAPFVDRRAVENTSTSLLDSQLAQLAYRLNGILPKSVAIQQILVVSEEMHARYSATRRAYQYHLHHQKNPFLQGQSWYHPKPLDYAAMNAAAQILIGEHNFQSFSKVHTEVKHFNCKVWRAEWQVLDAATGRMVFHIAANRFLRGMVRAVVGTLVQVGLGRMNPADIPAILEQHHRSAAGSAAPAEGLFLSEVVYPGVQW